MSLERNLNNQPRKTHLLVTEAIKASGKTPAEIAEAMGYSSDRVKLIEMIMEGRSKLPINKVVSFAKAVGLEPAFVFETVMQEYSPDTWETIQQIYGSAIAGRRK